MARRRKAKTRTITRYMKKARRAVRSPVSPSAIIIPSMVYGGLREKLSNALTPVTSKIPLGGVGDELVIGGLAYIGAKKIRNKFARSMCMAALTVEAARVGEAVATGQIGIGGSSSSSGEFI